MIIVNTETVEGREIEEVYGMVRGNIVHSKNVIADITASIRSLIGGEVKEYTDMLTESRKKSIHRMVVDAESKGANAIVNVRFVTSQVMQGASELLVYGTAVKLKESD